MASNMKKTKFKAGDILKRKWHSTTVFKHIMILEAVYKNQEELTPSYYILSLETGEKVNAFRSAVEDNYSKVA